ncbi:hypothetical protein BDZ97DRAFT_2081817 [Flammula alnicola]|nr:hypothetical protein BDZ97DRAFT_2081817 [Flammula alnicola]
MPESFVLAYFLREIAHLASKKGTTSKLPASHPQEHGLLVFHPPCCAKVDGNRQTVTIHRCRADDPVFHVLPEPRKRQPPKSKHPKKKPLEEEDHICKACTQPDAGEDDEDEDEDVSLFDNIPSSDGPNIPSSLPLLKGEEVDLLRIKPDLTSFKGKPAADIANALQIQGELLCVSRGKEIVLAIANFIIRICFGVEGHCFWLPTSVYRALITDGPVDRGAKSKTFAIPAEYQDGPPGNVHQLSMQAAFVRPDWTLVFVDHNVMITFHIMALQRTIRRSDLEPGSPLWPSLWSATHGPVHSSEPIQALKVLDRWRQVSLVSQNSTAIFLAVKSNQKVFNGYGAQETCDMLCSVFIHPCMPVYQICADESLWKRFKQGVLDYQCDRLKLLETGSFPHVSGPRPFQMNHNAHDRFMAHVLCYRTRYVFADQLMLDGLHSRDLLNPHAIIQPTGTAQDSGESEVSLYAGTKVPKQPPTTVRWNRLRLPNYLLIIPRGRSSNKTYKVYTPIIARPGNEDWWPIQSVSVMDHDVRNIFSSTTLGPYSFSVFIQGAWTEKKVGDEVPKGRRPLQAISSSRRKRPRASDFKTSGEPAKKKPKNILANNTENIEPVELNTRTMRSGRKLALMELHAVMPFHNYPQYEPALVSQGVLYVNNTSSLAHSFFVDIIGIPEGAVGAFLEHCATLTHRAHKGKANTNQAVVKKEERDVVIKEEDKEN